MKKNFMLLIGLILFIPNMVLANSISNIDMNIYVDDSGTAHVTEEWTANLYEGTEGYKPYYNLGESEISNFKVKMNGTDFSYLDNWNVSGSFEDKKYKNGINYTSNGLELCFGISSYGSNTYTLSYDISNFVVNTSDGYQMIYWNLFPYDFNPSPGRVYIKIYSDFKYSDSLDVWGYGKYGAPTYVYDGYIEMDSESTVFSDEYMTILVKFPSNSFNTSITLNNNFDYYYKMSLEKSTSSKEKNQPVIVKESKKSTLYNLSVIIFLVLIFLLFILLLVRHLKYKEQTQNIKKINYNYGYKNNIKIDKNKVPLFRDIPCNKDIYYANSLIKLNKFNIKNSNILGAIILKWVKDDKIEFKSEKTGIFNKETSIINMTSDPKFDNEHEKKLFNIMREASKDGILTAKEFEIWCYNNFDCFFNIFASIEEDELNKLKEAGHIYKRHNKKECSHLYVMDQKIYNDSIDLYGLKLFLTDFSQIKKREVIEVKLWNEYLMFAYLFGIADKVSKQLKNMYPEIEQKYNNFDISTFDFISDITYSSINFARQGRSKAYGKTHNKTNYIDSNIGGYSSGGGGFSSGGGGGGSFGGGGGGGGFR